MARAYEWISPWRDSPGGIPRIGDVTGDGKPELVTTGQDEIFVYDLDTLGLLNPPKQVAERSNTFTEGLPMSTATAAWRSPLAGGIR